MSYNITNFKLKKLEDLKIPIKSFYKSERKDWHPDTKIEDEVFITLTICETEINGTIENELFSVNEINISGEGSGCALHYVLTEAFKDSTGILEAVCVWEGGDSISKLIVVNGELKWEDIED